MLLNLSCDPFLLQCSWCHRCALRVPSVLSSRAAGSSLHLGFSAFQSWGLSSHPTRAWESQLLACRLPSLAWRLPSPITDKSCVKSFRFLTPGYMSLYKTVCLLPSHKWEAVVLQEETTWELSLRDKVHVTVNNMTQAALGRCRRWYDLCQLFEQNLPTPVNTLALHIFCFGKILVAVEAIAVDTETQRLVYP